MTVGEFVLEGYITGASVKAKMDKGAVIKTLEVKITVPEPVSPDGKTAFAGTAKDLTSLAGERLVIHGQTIQAKLPLT